MSASKIFIDKTERVFSHSPVHEDRVIPLSLQDATTANFGLAEAIWLFEQTGTDPFNAAAHLRHTLEIILNNYPQLLGQLKAFDTVEGPATGEVAKFPAHARRFGRVYVHFGGSADVGVEFVTASSTSTLKSLYPASRTEKLPIWSRQEDELGHFAASCEISNALQPNEPDPTTGLRKPVMAIQCTQLMDGGFVLAVKIAHPLADISTLVCFVEDWAIVSRSALVGTATNLPKPVFDPACLDSLAAGNINADAPDPAILREVQSLPLHRYDWWAAPGKPPPSFINEPQSPAGSSMPWHEWDVQVPVSSDTIHFTRSQIDHLYQEASQTASTDSLRVSRHDALLAHIWSCITRARRIQPEDHKPVHCDLVLGLRPALICPQTSSARPQ